MSILRRFSSLIVIAAIFMLSGCASIVSTSRWPTKINSVPQDADVTITDGREGGRVFSGKTPTTATLSPNSGFFKGKEYNVQASKQGYTTQTLKINSVLTGWYVMNIWFGGLIGMLIVDPATGAMWTLDNKDINLKLEKSAHAKPAIKAPSQKVDISPSSSTANVVTVTWTSVWVRSGPGNNHSVATSVKQGDELIVIGKSGEWLNVRLDNGRIGWVRNVGVK